jgi:hypothetical protein
MKIMQHKIKKRWIVLLCFLILYVFLVEKRSFYCFENGKCVTVWNGYVMPYKYYGLFYPKDNYIKTDTHETFIRIYWSDSFPEKVFFGVSPNSNLIEVVNESKEKGTFTNIYKSDEEFRRDLLRNPVVATRIKEEYRNILYDENAQTVKDVKKDVSFLGIDIQYNRLINKIESKK